MPTSGKSLSSGRVVEIMQTIIMYAMLDDAIITKNPSYPYVPEYYVLDDVFSRDFNPDTGLYENVSPKPLTVPMNRISLGKPDFDMKMGRRPPSKRYKKGKQIWVCTSMWYNQRRKEDGWHENFVWNNQRGIPYIRKPEERGVWLTYQGHPLKTGVWRVMLPSEMRQFCSISEDEWQEWKRENGIDFSGILHSYEAKEEK